MNNDLRYRDDNFVTFPIGVKPLANLILSWASDLSVKITPMKLQKLIYFCHADFLITTGQPLIEQSFEAWDYGPVVPCLYQEFKSYGAQPIDSLAQVFNPTTCKREYAAPTNLGQYTYIVRSTFDAYLKYTASALSEMSHLEKGPWAEALRQFSKGSPEGRRIKNQIIVKYHQYSNTKSIH